MSTLQADFAAALLNAARPAPAGVNDGTGQPAGKRFDVYRNNVAVSLTEALETGFPVIRRLVGDEFFKAMAGVHLRAHPPRNALMMEYGQDMPGFLETFEPARSLPYLPDIARLELALRRAYHAADAAPIDPARLAAVPADRLGALRLQLAPAVALISSTYPILSIWRANTGDGGATPLPRPEAALILRPGLDPSTHDPGPGAAPVIDALLAGATLENAVARAEDEFELSALLGLLLSTRSITGVDAPD